MKIKKEGGGGPARQRGGGEEQGAARVALALLPLVQLPLVLPAVVDKMTIQMGW